MREYFWDTCLSVRSLIVAAIVAAYTWFGLRAPADGAERNLWDAVFPVVAETKITSMLWLLWAVSMIVPICYDYGRSEIMLRHGSWKAAVGAGLRELAGRFAGSGLVVLLASTVVALPLGLDAAWSPLALTEASGEVRLSAFSASALARYFPNPLIALLSCVLYSVFAYLVIAAVAMAVAARGYVTIAVRGLMVFYVWALVCSFLVGMPKPLDASQATSLAWALSENGVAQAMAGFVVCCLVVVLLTRVGRLRTAAAEAVRNRGAAMAMLLVVTVVGSVQVASRSGSLEDFATSYFAGSHGDIFRYIATATIPIIVATTFVADLSVRGEGVMLYEAVRAGSFRRWTFRILSLGLVRAILASVAFGVGLVLTYVFCGAGGGNADGMRPLLLGVSGVAAESALLICVATAVFWLRGSLGAWPAVIAVALILGYPFLIHLGPVNIFAPYSIRPDAVGESHQVSALIACMAVAALGAAVALIQSNARRGAPVAESI